MLYHCNVVLIQHGLLIAMSCPDIIDLVFIDCNGECRCDSEEEADQIGPESVHGDV